MSVRYLWVIVPVSLAALSWGDSPARPDLNGSWRLEPSRCEVHSRLPDQLTWQIEQTYDAIHVIQKSGDKNTDEFRCATDGKDCKVKEAGHKAVLSFYYNGPALIELQTEGQDNVVKKKMQLSSDGSTLTVEVVHITPVGKEPEKLVLTKEAAAGH